MFTLESPHRGDSNEYTQYTIFNMNKKNILNYPKSAAMGFFSKGLKNEFETAVVNEPSVFEPLKFYCIQDSNIFGIFSSWDTTSTSLLTSCCFSSYLLLPASDFQDLISGFLFPISFFLLFISDF